MRCCASLQARACRVVAPCLTPQQQRWQKHPTAVFRLNLRRIVYPTRSAPIAADPHPPPPSGPLAGPPAAGVAGAGDLPVGEPGGAGAALPAQERQSEHRKFKHPLQARQALGKPDTTAWFGPCAPIHSLTRHLEPGPDTARAASHAHAPRFTRGLRLSAGTVTLVARSAVPAAGHARQPRHAFGGCGALGQSPEAPLHQVRAQCTQASPVSRTRPWGGGCGSSPRWPRFFSITGRSRMAAMILSSPAPQFGPCCMSMSKRSFSADQLVLKSCRSKRRA
jgi:hypothetical protein